MFEPIPIEIANKQETIQNKDGFCVSTTLPGITPRTAGNYGVFFIAPFPCEVLSVSEVHQNNGTITNSTLQVEKLTSNQALRDGAFVCKTGFLMTTSANIPRTRTGYAELQNTTLVKGDRLALYEPLYALDAITGICVTVHLKPSGKGDYR